MLNMERRLNKMRKGQKPCPKCGSENIEYTYASCQCCRTYEGNGTT